MLELARIDLDALCEALEDHSYDSSWWLDPERGEVEMYHPDLEGEIEHPQERGFVFIEPFPSSEGYRDMEDFIALVPDRRAADPLARAIAGRGAFRRFKDTLYEFPELREAWFAFRDTRLERRAIEWLLGGGLIGEEEARRGLEERPDPNLFPGQRPPVDSWAVAHAVAADLKALYGDRLVDVVLYGSRARGDAHDESDLDLMVVLEDPVDRWKERRRIGDILWDHSLDSNILVSAMVVGRSDFEAQVRPVIVNACREGRSVA